MSNLILLLPVLDILPQADIIKLICVDTMHLIKGYTELLIMLTFNIGGAGRPRDTSLRRLDVSEIEEWLRRKSKVPSEFSRRTREISGSTKAEEFRNFLIAFFPLFLRNIPGIYFFS